MLPKFIPKGDSMLTFFHGWRRKMGAVTVLVACVFAAAWYRSQSVVDRILIPYSFSRPTLASMPLGIAFEYSLSETTPFSGFSWESVSPRTMHSDEEKLRLDMESIESRRPGLFPHWGFCGVSVETLLSRRRFILSQWWIVSPLTLLSAYLLLSKPRPKQTQPVPHA